MRKSGFRHVYGPVPSRRLGHSLGIDLVPFKTCTYDCVYCQLGRTTIKTPARKEYVSISEIMDELKLKLTESNLPDYISLSGSGEPTLNSRTGELIRNIKGITDIPVAVLTNGSLLWMKEVQDELMAADLVLASLDAGDESLFRYVNRPHEDIGFEKMVEGLVEFTRRFPGKVWLEVLLLEGVTGMPSHVKKIAALVKRIAPARVQLNTVCRPPAEEFAFPLTLDQMLSLKDLFPGNVEVITEYNEDISHLPSFSKDRKEEVLALLHRRPCTFEDVAGGLGIHVTEVLKILNMLINEGTARFIVKGGRNFYIAAGMESSLKEEGEK